MKYIAVLDTDEIEDFDFFEDGKEKYLHAIDANSVNGEWIYLPFKPLEHEDLGVDCISRADVLKLMQDNWHTHNGDWAMQESMDDIRVLPSVTPQEPKTGHWIDNMDLGYHVSFCSNCNWRGLGDTCLIYKPKYCPNCGAKMVEL